MCRQEDSNEHTRQGTLHNYIQNHSDKIQSQLTSANNRVLRLYGYLLSSFTFYSRCSVLVTSHFILERMRTFLQTFLCPLRSPKANTYQTHDSKAINKHSPNWLVLHHSSMTHIQLMGFLCLELFLILTRELSVLSNLGSSFRNRLLTFDTIVRFVSTAILR